MGEVIAVNYDAMKSEWQDLVAEAVTQIEYIKLDAKLERSLFVDNVGQCFKILGGK